MANKNVITDDMKEKFVEDYTELRSISALAKKWGINWRTAKAALLRFGVESLEQTKDEYHPKLGVWSDRRIAKDLGVSHQAVARARQRRGLESAWAKALSILGAE